MKRTALLAVAVALCAAPFLSATAPIMKEAQAKDKSITSCKSCHTALPGKKDNLNDTGKKFMPAAKK